jgi:hypothetical protein
LGRHVFDVERNGVPWLSLTAQDLVGYGVFDAAGHHAAHGAGAEAGVVTLVYEAGDGGGGESHFDFLGFEGLIDFCEHDGHYLAKLLGLERAEQLSRRNG